MLVGALDTDVESAQIAAEVKLENLISRGLLGGRPAGRRAGPLPHRAVRGDAAAEARRHPARRALGRLARRRARAARRGAHPHRGPLPRRDGDPGPHRHRPRRGDRADAAQAGRRAGRRRPRLHPAPHPAADAAAGGGRRRSGRSRTASSSPTGRAARRSTCSASSCGRASRLHIATAVEPTAAFFRAGTGVRVPSVPSLGGLVETLLTPPSERDPLGEPVPEPELAPAAPDPFGDDRWASGSTPALPADGPRRRLSGLLAEARAADPDLPQLVALRGAARGRLGRRDRPQPGRRASAAGRRRRHGAARRRVRRRGPARRHGGGAVSDPGDPCPCPAVDVESAARLVAHGMRPKALPARDPAYADLVRRYREDDAFADTVQRVASGLGLVVLAVGARVRHGAGRRRGLGVRDPHGRVRAAHRAGQPAGRQGDARARAPRRGRAGLPPRPTTSPTTPTSGASRSTRSTARCARPAGA